jgi:multiple sugar transport system permease protein
MRRVRRHLPSILAHGLLITASLLVILPLLWILRTAFVTRVDAYQIPPKWLTSLTTINFETIFGSGDFGRFTINSLAIALGTTILAVVLGAPAAYAIARFRTGGTPMRLGILIGQMFPPIVLVLPIFVILTELELRDTRTALVLTYLSFNLAFVIWVLAGFFSSIPRDSEEAALIDGCSRLQAFRKVIVPVALPGLFAAAILSFILSWTEFLFALILTGNDSRTLPVAIAALATRQGVSIGAVCAAVTVLIIPTTLLAILIRTFLVRGLTLGGVKG